MKLPALLTFDQQLSLRTPKISALVSLEMSLSHGKSFLVSVSVAARTCQARTPLPASPLPDSSSMPIISSSYVNATALAFIYAPICKPHLQSACRDRAPWHVFRVCRVSEFILCGGCGFMSYPYGGRIVIVLSYTEPLRSIMAKQTKLYRVPHRQRKTQDQSIPRLGLCTCPLLSLPQGY